MKNNSLNPVKTGLLAIVASIAGFCAAQAQSTSYPVYAQGQYTVVDGKVHYWGDPSSPYGSASYNIYDIASGTTQTISGPSNINSNGFGDAFGVYDKTTSSFYLGTFANNGSSYVYRYNTATGQWSSGTHIVNAYGAATYNGNLYISGLNEPWSGGYGQDTYISLFREDGQHDMLIQASGNSAYMATDRFGNVYYATFSPNGNNAIYRWLAEDIAGVIDDPATSSVDRFLTFDQAEILTYFTGGANGIAVGPDGRVYFTSNLDGGYVGVVNPDIEGDYKYEKVYEGGGWLGALYVDGDQLYISDYGQPLFSITVPEPATVALLMGAGALLLTAAVRKRRNRVA